MDPLSELLMSRAPSSNGRINDPVNRSRETTGSFEQDLADSHWEGDRSEMDWITKDSPIQSGEWFRRFEAISKHWFIRQGGFYRVNPKDGKWVVSNTDAALLAKLKPEYRDHAFLTDTDAKRFCETIDYAIETDRKRQFAIKIESLYQELIDGLAEAGCQPLEWKEPSPGFIGNKSHPYSAVAMRGREKLVYRIHYEDKEAYSAGKYWVEMSDNALLKGIDFDRGKGFDGTRSAKHFCQYHELQAYKANNE